MSGSCMTRSDCVATDTRAAGSASLHPGLDSPRPHRGSRPAFSIHEHRFFTSAGILASQEQRRPPGKSGERAARGLRARSRLSEDAAGLWSFVNAEGSERTDHVIASAHAGAYPSPLDPLSPGFRSSCNRFILSGERGRVQSLHRFRGEGKWLKPRRCWDRERRGPCGCDWPGSRSLPHGRG
jgi:hypothetical protein